jgi:AcrR family transcriptional regulator
MRTSKPRESAPGSLTRDRIIEAANVMFAEHGVEGVSLRELTVRAGVNLAAVHYHFGSKEGVLAELFARSSKPIVEWRLELLGKVRRRRDGRPVLEDVLDAFLRPALHAGRRQNASFVHLRARLALERGEATRRILSESFDESSRQFMDALAAAMPDLRREELNWRFHFLIGAMVYTMADSGRIQTLSDGTCDPSDSEEALDRMVAVFAGVFRAGASGKSPAKARRRPKQE